MADLTDSTPTLNRYLDFPYMITPFPIVFLRSMGVLPLPSAPKKNVEEALE